MHMHTMQATEYIRQTVSTFVLPIAAGPQRNSILILYLFYIKKWFVLWYRIALELNWFSRDHHKSCLTTSAPCLDSCI